MDYDINWSAEIVYRFLPKMPDPFVISPFAHPSGLRSPLSCHAGKFPPLGLFRQKFSALLMGPQSDPTFCNQSFCASVRDIVQHSLFFNLLLFSFLKPINPSVTEKCLFLGEEPLFAGTPCNFNLGVEISANSSFLGTGTVKKKRNQRTGSSSAENVKSYVPTKIYVNTMSVKNRKNTWIPMIASKSTVFRAIFYHKKKGRKKKKSFNLRVSQIERVWWRKWKKSFLRRFNKHSSIAFYRIFRDVITFGSSFWILNFDQEAISADN